MLQRTSKENSMAFLEMDYDKLSKEVEQVKTARDNKPADPIRLAKQTSGNMYKQKSLINFLEPNSVPSPQRKTEVKVDPEPAKKLNSNFDPMQTTSRSVRSARTGTITDNGGPSKFIKSETTNSIWDSGKLQSLAKQVDSKEATEQEKNRIEQNKRNAEQERMQQLASVLKETDQRKDSYVKELGSEPAEVHGLKPPKSGISIFDNVGNFSRIPEKTAGETAIDEARTEQKERADNAFLPSGKVLSSKSVLNRLFDGLTKGE